MPACCTIAAGFDVMNSAALYIDANVCSLACAQPSRQPVMLYVFEKLLTTMTRSLFGRDAGKRRRQRGVVDQPLVDLVGQDDEVVTLAQGRTRRAARPQ